MSLDGLRAWIGEVERKLGMRTRVFLVLTVIAIGGAGAGIYLAIDARDNSVSESDVQALQEQLETRIGEGGGGVPAGPGAVQLKAELEALQAQVEQLEGESGSEKGKGAGKGGAGTSGGGASSARLQELLERAKEESEKNK